MKSIANQYRDLKEGKMTQSNFMRNLRMSMPQYITNVTSFKDAVRILKNKAILSEAEINELSPQTKYNAAIKAADRAWSFRDSDSKYRKALRQGNKFIEEIDPVLKKTVEDFGKSLGFETKIEKGATSFQYQPIVKIAMGKDLRNPEIKIVITKNSDKIEGSYNLPDESYERRLANLIQQIQKKELDVELKETLNENRAFEVAKALRDKYQMDADGIYVYLIDDMGLDNMAAQSVIDQLFGEDGEDGDEMDDLIKKIGQEEEEEKAIKGGFGIYDPMEENQDEDKVKALANNYFPRDPEEMAELVASKHGSELKPLLGKGNNAQKLALSYAYEEILNSGHPKAKIIAQNLVWGYADEDWPMDYISTLFPILRKEDLNEYEHTYRKIDGVCYKIDDEGNRTKVADHYCRYSEDLNEAKKKAEPKAKLHPNQIHPGELRMGIRVEMEHTDDPKKAEKIALDHLAENPFYYTALKLAGVESPSAPKVKAPAEKKAKKKKEAVELVDKANAMQKVKMPKIVKEAQISAALPNEEINNTTKQVLQYIDSDIANPVLKSLSKDIKLQSLRDNRTLLRYMYWEPLPDPAIRALELQFKVEGDTDIDDDTAPREYYILSPKSNTAKNLGSSLETGASKASQMDTFKEVLEKLVREALAETFDGRDNLANITDDTK